MRIPYDGCPLCTNQNASLVCEADATQHNSYKPELPKTLRWLECEGCGHIYTDGYWSDEALQVVFTTTQEAQTVGVGLEQWRYLSATTVQRIASYVPDGDWLDIGTGNGSLLFTAAEWGYNATGTDLRPDTVAKVQALGYQCALTDLDGIDEQTRLDVVSMADVLEHMPFPRAALEKLHAIMRPGAALFVSMPNMDTAIWKALDAMGENPYWGEIEHYHNFTRARLVRLLKEEGFEVKDYNISNRYRSCMEVIALRAE